MDQRYFLLLIVLAAVLAVGLVALVAPDASHLHQLAVLPTVMSPHS